MKKIKIVLVDDHRIVRDGIKTLLELEEDIEVISEASNYSELKDILHVSIPDIILMDISLSDKSGIEITKEIKKHYSIKVIMLSMYLSEEFIVQSFQCGADSYLPKNTSKDELLMAVRQIAMGEEFYHSQVSKILLKSRIKNPLSEQSNSLSKREIEIVTLFANGLGNKEIAEKLFISTRTVESHKNHIMQKLNLKNPVELIKYAIKNNIVKLE